HSLGPHKSCSVTVLYSPTGGIDMTTLTATGNKSSALASATLTGFSAASFNTTACSGASCNVAANGPNGSSITVTATGNQSSSGTLQAGVIPQTTLPCTGYGPQDLRLNPNTYEVLSTSSAYAKLASI